jgi:polyribonucleotide nucleotidyltransferase
MHHEEKTYSCEVGGQTMTFRTGKLAQLAGGAVTVQVGETVILATATAGKGKRPINFLPLSVDVEEKMYAAGRIPGSFFRREGRPSEVSILAARLIDRPLRPLFPKSMRNEIQIISTVVSSDGIHYFDIPSLCGASAALMISDIILPEPVAAVRVGLVDDQLVVNPTTEQMVDSELDLRVAGTESAILMVECGANEVDEETMLRAIRTGHEAMQPIIQLQHRMREEVGKPKRVFELDELPEELMAAAAQHFGDRIDRMLEETAGQGKEALYGAVDEMQAEWMALYESQEEGEPPARLAPNGEAYESRHAKGAFDSFYRSRVRERILALGIRPDGRRPDEIRGLYAEVGMLPRAHGTGLFQRGETQVLSFATLGTLRDVQRLDNLRPEDTKRFMHHYNFPPYSTGETWFLRGPKRREIGHGALVETALRPVLPEEDIFPYAMRVVSEALSSNGSTSMASVCGTTLALMDAGVPIAMPVAGIAMGLITEGGDGRYQILTDIQGLEDHLGDMDFKVAGTEAGITALQMDIKVGGLSDEVLRQALAQARQARMQILDRMAETLPEPREELNRYAPRIISVKIDPEYIGKLIGPGGKNIRALEEDTGVKIDIKEDGTVFIASTEAEGADRAKEIIAGLTQGAELGKTYTGTVVRITDFGCFVEIFPGMDGLVHISQLASERVDSVQSVVEEGDEILVMVTDVQDGKVRLSRQAVLEGWTLEQARESDSAIGQRSGGRGGRGGGGGRGGRGRR